MALKRNSKCSILVTHPPTCSVLLKKHTNSCALLKLSLLHKIYGVKSLRLQKLCNWKNLHKWQWIWNNTLRNYYTSSFEISILFHNQAGSSPFPIVPYRLIQRFPVLNETQSVFLSTFLWQCFWSLCNSLGTYFPQLHITLLKTGPFLTSRGTVQVHHPILQSLSVE